MQTLPVILAVFVAAAAIIAVLLWRLKPQAAPSADALDKRLAEEVKRTEILQSKLDVNEATLRNALTGASATNATAEAAEKAKNDLEQRLASLTAKYDALIAEHKLAVERAATAENEATNTRIRNGEVLKAYEIKEQEIDQINKDLNEALAKQKADEAASDQFKVISQTILKDVLGDAKREIAELAVTLKKGSDAELDKHAEKVTQTLEPLHAKLLAYDEAVESLKKGTQENYGSLRNQLEELQKTERLLHDEAKALTFALSSSPKVTGNYGELKLKRLIEFAGLQEHHHFELQPITNTEEGKKIPDLIVLLPGGQKVIVDAKAVMEACVKALQTQDDASRKALLDQHSKNVKSRVIDLSAKNYFAEHRNAMDAVILFLPAEHLYSTAVENDPNLIEFALERNIIICGPNSLMVLLKVANQLWQRASIEEEALKIKECGDAIYNAACAFIQTYATLGERIRQLENAYNIAAGTLNHTLIPKGRSMGKFTAVVSNKKIEDASEIKDGIKSFSSPEAKKILALTTEKLPGLSLGEYETAKLNLPLGDE